MHFLTNEEKYYILWIWIEASLITNQYQETRIVQEMSGIFSIFSWKSQLQNIRYNSIV